MLQNINLVKIRNRNLIRTETYYYFKINFSLRIQKNQTLCKRYQFQHQ